MASRAYSYWKEKQLGLQTVANLKMVENWVIMSGLQLAVKMVEWGEQLAEMKVVL